VGERRKNRKTAPTSTNYIDRKVSFSPSWTFRPFSSTLRFWLLLASCCPRLNFTTC